MVMIMAGVPSEYHVLTKSKYQFIMCQLPVCLFFF